MGGKVAKMLDIPKEKQEFPVKCEYSRGMEPNSPFSFQIICSFCSDIFAKALPFRKKRAKKQLRCMFSFFFLAVS
jgi:hypothetical protein